MNTNITIVVLDPSVQSFYDVAVPIYAVVIPVMLVMCLLAFLANCLVLFSYCWIRDRLSPTLKLTFSLAAADAWTTLIITVGLVANSYVPHVLLVPKSDRQDCGAYALEALRMGSILTSVLHLLALSVNHYSATAWPVRYRIWSARSWLFWTMVFMWTAPPLGFLATFLAYSDETFDAERCSPDFLDKTALRLGVFALIFVPLTAMTAVYIKIAYLLSALQRHLRQNGGASYRTSQQQQRSLKRKARAIITGLLIVSTFLIGWVPSIVLYAVTCKSCVLPYKELIKQPRTMLTLAILANTLMIVKCLLNPLIYGVRVPEIRCAITDSLHNCCGRRKPSVTAAHDGDRLRHTVGETSTLFHLTANHRLRGADNSLYYEESVLLCNNNENDENCAVHCKRDQIPINRRIC